MEDSSKLGGLGMVRCAQVSASSDKERERDFIKTYHKKSLERGCRRVWFTPHSPPTHGPSHSKTGGATTRTARGEGGRHRAEGWHARREAEQQAQQEHYQHGSAHVCSILVMWGAASAAPAPAGLCAVSCSLPRLLPLRESR